MRKITNVIGFLMVIVGAHGIGRRSAEAEKALAVAAADRAGFVRAYKEALPIGACYGARSLAGNIGLPVEINCPPIAPELLPDRPKDEESEE